MMLELLRKQADEYIQDGDMESLYKILLEMVMSDDVWAYHGLADMYYKGIYVRQDYEKAYRYYDYAAQNGDRGSMHQIITMDLCDIHDSEPEKFMKYLSILEKDGDTTACIYLGQEYLSGRFIERNVEKAIEYYEKAGKAGESVGYESIGILYFDGKYIHRDYEKAYEYFLKSELMLPESRYKLGVMYEFGLGVEQDLDMAKTYYQDVANSFDFELAETHGIVDDYYVMAREKLAQIENKY